MKFMSGAVCRMRLFVILLMLGHCEMSVADVALKTPTRFDKIPTELTSSAISSVAIQPAGKLLAVAHFCEPNRYDPSASKNGAITIWSTEDRRLLMTLQGHSKPVCGVAWRGDGKVLASCAEDNSVILWDGVRFSNRKKLVTLPQNLRSVQFSADGKRLAVSGITVAWVVDAGTGQILFTSESNHCRIQAMKISPDGKWLATAHMQGGAYLWSLQQKLPPVIIQPNKTISDLAFSSDSKKLTLSVIELAEKPKSYLARWNIVTAKLEKTLNVPNYGGSNRIMLVHDSDQIVLGNLDGSVQLVHFDSGKCIQSISAHSSIFTAIDIDYQTSTMVTGDLGGECQIWKLQIQPLP